MKHKIIPVFIPHMGCPNVCSFCNQRYITNQEKFDWEKIESNITMQIEKLKYLDDLELAFFGGSFTMIDEFLQEKLLSYAKKHLDKGNIKHIRISTRPDAIDDKCIKKLKYYGVDFVELGIQSFSEDVLIKNKRFYGNGIVEKSIESLKRNKMNFGLQLLYGLLGETKEIAYASICKAMEYKPKTLRLYPIIVLEHTLLAECYKNKTYFPPTKEEVIEVGAFAYAMCIRHNVELIRVGLYPEDSMLNHRVAGYFHPAYKTLMETFLFKEVIKKLLMDNKNNFISIGIPKPFFNGFVGYKGSNLKLIREKNSNIKVLMLSDKEDEIKIITKDFYTIVYNIYDLINDYLEKVMKCI